MAKSIHADGSVTALRRPRFTILSPNPGKRSAERFYFLFFPSLVLAVCYLFWLNVYWDLNVIFYELEYNFVYMIILSSFVNFFMNNWKLHSASEYKKNLLKIRDDLVKVFST